MGMMGRVNIQLSNCTVRGCVDYRVVRVGLRRDSR